MAVLLCGCQVEVFRGLTEGQVNVMLVPVREQVSVPIQPAPTFMGLPFLPENGPPYALIGAALVLVTVLVGLVLFVLALRARKRGKDGPDEGA